VDGLSLDQKVDFAYARKAVGDSICLIGNVNPAGTLFLGKPEDAAREAEYAIRSAGQNGNFILSSGCLMPPDIPPENLQAMVDTAKRVGMYPLA
jgi:uroporphyrinogen decarboxylase